jgi:hypothetical protein
MKASVNTTSLKSRSPLIWRIGLMRMPGAFISTRNCDRPWRRLSAAGGEVRKRPSM